MRVMVLVNATKGSETGILPSAAVLNSMGRFSEELVKARVMLAGEGLKPPSQDIRVTFDERGRTVIGGPFTETCDLLPGF